MHWSTTKIVLQMLQEYCYRWLWKLYKRFDFWQILRSLIVVSLFLLHIETVARYVCTMFSYF